jgi:hypothetical protein
MSELARTGFLIRGTKEKSEGDVFYGHHLHQIPHLYKITDRLSLLHTDVDRTQFENNLGTDMLEKYGNYSLLNFWRETCNMIYV